jgi:hypothetical protein
MQFLTFAGRGLRLGLVLSLACAMVGTAFSQQPDGDTAPEAPPERTVYVPYKDLKGVFDQLGAGVLIPYSDWLELWRAHGEGTGEKPAVEAVITQAAYTATIEKDIARIKAVLTINVLGEPWVEVPIRFGEAAVGKLEGNENVLLRGTGDGTYSLLLGQKGEQTVTLELVARVNTSPDGREFTLDVPPVGITSIDVIIPEADQTVEITPRLVSLPVEGAVEGQTHVSASLGSTGRIVARWHPRVSMKPEMDLLTSVTNLTQVTVEDGLIHADAYLLFDILRGELNELRIAVPADHRILDVASPAKIKGWRAEEADGQQVVTVEFLSAVENQVTIEVHTERKLPDDAFPVAGQAENAPTSGIHALDAVRESGQVVLRSASDLVLTLAEQQGVVRIETAQVDERIRSDGGMSFKFYSPQFTLTATARPIEPRIVVDHIAHVILREDEVRLEAALNYTVERAGLFQLVLNVPEQLVIDDVQCAQMKEFNFDDQARTLTIVLTEKTMGAIGVSVKAHRPFDAGADGAQLNLPLLEPQNVERETGSVYLFARESIEVVTTDADVVAAQPLPAPPGQQMGDAVLTAAWSFTRRPVTIPVTTKRKAARLNVDVATTVNVHPESAEVTTLLDYHVQFAGIDTFQFQAPEAVSPLLQIEVVSTDATTPGIKQKTPSDPADGWVTWTVVMQRDVLGLLRLSVTYDLKSAAADAAGDDVAEGPAADEVAVSLLKPLAAPASNGRAEVPVSRLRGEAAVLHEESLSVTASVGGGDVEAIDVRELTLLPQNGTLAYRYFKQPDEGSVQLTLTRTRHDIQEVVETVVRRALVEIINGEDGTAIYRVRMRVKTTERQRLLVDLPAQLELLGVFVDDRNVKLEQAGVQDAESRVQSFYVPVTRTKPVDEEFLLSFEFRWKVTPYLGESQFLRGRIDLPLPVLGGTDAQAAVQELRVAVWVPRKYALVGEPDNFVIERQPRIFSTLTNTTSQVDDGDLDNWIGNTDTSLEPAKKGLVGYVYSNLGGERRLSVVWWNRLWMTAIVSFAIALIAWVLGRTSWENKLWVLLMAGFILCLVALWDADWAAHALSAARFGLAFLIGWWLVTAFFGARNLRPPQTVQLAGAGATPVATGAPITPAVAPPPGAIDDLKRQAGDT